LLNEKRRELLPKGLEASLLKKEKSGNRVLES